MILAVALPVFLVTELYKWLRWRGRPNQVKSD